MMNFAARSFTEPPGLRNSALPRIVRPSAVDSLVRRMSGVLPTAAYRSLCRAPLARTLGFHFLPARPNERPQNYLYRKARDENKPDDSHIGQAPGKDRVIDH